MMPRRIPLPELAVSSLSAAAGPKVYRCGTLSYTLRSLIVLFGFLLWGDFCFSFMEMVGPSVLPLKLKALGASNTMISIVLTSLPNILGMTVAPWVSFRSDRTRSRWGRRIPFMFVTMPFLVTCLALVGWSETLVPWIQHVIPPLRSAAPATIAIWAVVVFWVGFEFFNMFVNSVFWYLFNDVVPPQFLGRFNGVFRMVGSCSSVIYNWFIYQHAETHMREILTGAALLYLVGCTLMCLFIKEGEYPPPVDGDRPKGILGGIKDYCRQSFSVRFYWYFYLMSAFNAMAGATAIFSVFFSKEMGLTLAQIGKLAVIANIGSLAATYITAIFVDRWHPLRITAYMAVSSAVGGFASWIWVAVTLPGSVYFWVCAGGIVLSRFSENLRLGCGLPLFMRLMPKSLYGQFSSANALVRSLALIIVGPLAGLYLDGLKAHFGGSDFAYRLIFVWPWIFGIVSATFTYLGYREWKRLGGDEGYRPPTPWTASGYEEVTDKVPTVVGRPRITMLALWLSVSGAVLNLLFVLVFMVFMSRHGLDRPLLWYAQAYVPIKLLLIAASLAQVLHVRRDIRAQARGERTRFGVPHHGVLLVNSIQSIAFFSVFWYQAMSMIQLNFQQELVFFGLTSLLSSLAGIVGLQIIRWMERGSSPARAPASAAFEVRKAGAAV